MKQQNLKNKKLEFVQRDKELNQYQLRIDNIDDMHKHLYPEWFMNDILFDKQHNMQSFSKHDTKILFRITRMPGCDKQEYKLLYAEYNQKSLIVIDFETNIIHKKLLTDCKSKKIEYDKDKLTSFLNIILDKLHKLNIPIFPNDNVK